MSQSFRAGGEKRVPRAVALLALLAAWLPAVLAQAPLASARAAQPADDTKHAVHLASPAVVRIIMGVEAQVVCQICDNGGPVTEPDTSQVYADTFSGSGTFVSPDGYILTADHVVNADISLVVQAADDYATAKGVAQADAENTFLQAYSAGQATVNYQSQTRRVFLSTGYTGQLTSPSQLQGFDVQSVVASSPQDRQDTAILKINAHDMPFLTLAAKGDVHVQDTVTAVAYPGDADTANFASLLDPSSTDANSLTSLLTPTVETGSIIKQDTFSDGSIGYETTDISFHGSSGGAVINANAQIVGFVDRFTSDPSSTRVTILNSSDTAGTYVGKAGIPAQPQGAFMTQWTKAIGEYDATSPCHFTRAASDLSALHSAYPQFGGIQPYLGDAQAQDTPAECPASQTNGNSGLIVGIAAGGGALLLALVGLLIVLARRGKAVRPSPAAIGSYGAPAAPSMPLSSPLMPTQPGGVYPSFGGPPPMQPTQAPLGMPGYPAGANAPQPGPAPFGPPQGQPQYPPAQPPRPQYPVAPFAPPQPIRQAGPMVDPSPPSSTVPGGAEARTVLAPQPGQGGQQPYFPPPQSGRYPPAFGQAPAPQPGLRRCANGHVFDDPRAQYCPVCGAPVGP